MIVKPKIFKPTGDYRVRFHYLDIENGELTNKIIERYVDSGGTVVAPDVPTSLTAVSKKTCALTFSSWNHTTFTNITRDLDVGAIYDTTDTKTHAFVTVNDGLTLPITLTKSDTSTLTISWGDGTSDYTTTSSGSITTSHTYSTAGTYEITIWISSGTFELGNNNTFIGNDDPIYFTCLNNLFIGTNVNAIHDYSIVGSVRLRKITIPSTVSYIGLYGLSDTRIEYLSLPTSITSLSKHLFFACKTLEFVSLPDTITSFGLNCFKGCYPLDSICFPPNLTSIADYCFGNCSSLTKITIPSSVTTLGGSIFSECYGLLDFSFSNNLTALSYNSFSNCSSLRNVNLNVSSLGSSSFGNCSSLKKITISTSSVPSSCFSGCNSLDVITLTQYTAPSTITTLANVNGFANISKQARFYVPVGSADVYKGATNWSTYANQIYEDTTENRALFGD